jgi:hypothetical protein
MTTETNTPPAIALIIGNLSAALGVPEDRFSFQQETAYEGRIEWTARNEAVGFWRVRVGLGSWHVTAYYEVLSMLEAAGVE